MILVPCKIENIKHRSNANLKEMLTDFINGDADCVKVENYPHKNATVAREVIYSAAKRHYKGQIKVFKSGDDIYLAKTIAIK